MIVIEEILPLTYPPQSDPARLTAQQSREQADRNAANLLRWYQREFGEVPGRVLAGEART